MPTPTQRKTHLPNRDDNHLDAPFVFLLERLAREEAQHVCGDDGEVRVPLRGLLALAPVDDVAHREHAGVSRQLERRPDLDAAVRREDVVAERGGDARVGARAECGYLCDVSASQGEPMKGRAAHNEVGRGELGPLAGGEADRACLGEGVDVFAEDNVYAAGEAAPLHILAEFLWVDVAKKHTSAVDDGDFRVLFGLSLKQTLELE